MALARRLPLLLLPALAATLLLVVPAAVIARAPGGHRCKGAHASCGGAKSPKRPGTKGHHKPKKGAHGGGSARGHAPGRSGGRTAPVAVCDDGSAASAGACADGTTPMFCADGSSPSSATGQCASGADPLACADGSVPASQGGACADGTQPADAYAPLTGTCADGSAPRTDGSCADGSVPVLSGGPTCADGSAPQQGASGAPVCADGSKPS